MFRRVIQLLVLGLVAHAAYQVVPPFYSFFKLRDAVQEMATYADTPTFKGRKLSTEQMRTQMAKLAGELDIPLDREDFEVKAANKVTVIDARYTLQLEYLPTQFYPYEFVIHAEGGPSRYRSVNP